MDGSSRVSEGTLLLSILVLYENGLFLCTNKKDQKIVQCRRLAQPSLQEVLITFCGEIARLSSDREEKFLRIKCYFGGKAPNRSGPIEDRIQKKQERGSKRRTSSLSVVP